MATKTLHATGLLKVSNSNTFNGLTQSHYVSHSPPPPLRLPPRQKNQLAQKRQIVRLIYIYVEY